MYQFHGPVRCFPLQSVSVLVVHSGDCELSIRSDTKNDVRSTVTEDDPGHCGTPEGLSFFRDNGEADRPDAADDSDREGEAAER